MYLSSIPGTLRQQGIVRLCDRAVSLQMQCATTDKKAAAVAAAPCVCRRLSTCQLQLRRLNTAIQLKLVWEVPLCGAFSRLCPPLLASKPPRLVLLHNNSPRSHQHFVCSHRSVIALREEPLSLTHRGHDDGIYTRLSRGNLFLPLCPWASASAEARGDSGHSVSLSFTVLHTVILWRIIRPCRPTQ